MTKHEQTLLAIKERITSGEYIPGGRLPSERALAQELKVSYMTLRKAMLEMHDSGIVEKRAQEGTFLSENGLSILAARRVHFLFSKQRSLFVNFVEDEFVRYFEDNNFTTSVMHYGYGVENEIVRLLKNSEPVISFWSPAELSDTNRKRIMEASKASNTPLIVVGLASGSFHNICADDPQAMQTAISHLNDNGHKNISLLARAAFLGSDRFYRIKPWFDYVKECRKDLNFEQRSTYFLGDVQREGIVAQRNHVMSLMKTMPQDSTALICQNQYLLNLLISAAGELKIRIPEDLSVVVLGDAERCKIALPPITAVDINLHEHAEKALQIIRNTKEDGIGKPSRHLVKTKLIQRESVKLVNSE